LRPAGTLIGHVVCVPAEPAELCTWQLGYVFHPAYHGQGYATEACRRLLERAFGELGAHRVTAGCDPDNAPSWRLLERLGFRREAHRRKAGFLRKTPDGAPIWRDSFEYAILDEEWRPTRRPPPSPAAPG
jgi:RimJ/RimL family protein N-acetyltransferase